jgi:PAS domain-containing protein
MEQKRTLRHTHCIVMGLILVLGIVATWLFMELRDVKERLAKEAGSWTRLIQTLRSSNTGLFEVMSGDNKLFFASTEAHGIFGYALGEMDGMPLDAIMPEKMVYDHEKKMLDSMDKAKRHAYPGPKVIPIECKGRHKDGHEFDIVLRIMLGDESVHVFVNKAEEAKFLPMGKYPNMQTPVNPHSFGK